MFDIAPKLRSVANALTILDLLAELGELSLVEIAARLDVAPSTAHRLLATLAELGYVQRDPANKRYRIALKVFRIGTSAIQQIGLAHIALPEMTRLSALSAETVSLGVPHGVEMMYIERIEAPQTVRSDYPLGHCAPAYCTALGKAYLAALPVEERRRLLDRVRLEPRTRFTIVDRDQLERELERVRLQGYAVEIGASKRE